MNTGILSGTRTKYPMPPRAYGNLYTHPASDGTVHHLAPNAADYMAGTGTLAMSVDDRAFVMPLRIGRAALVSAISIDISGAATAGRFLRYALYADRGDFFPGQLVVDAGQIASNATGNQTIQIMPPILVPAGVYWVAIADQGSGATNPTVRAFSASAVSLPTQQTIDSNNYGCYILDGVSGPFPQTWTGLRTVSGSSFPKPWVTVLGVRDEYLDSRGLLNGFKRANELLDEGEEVLDPNDWDFPFPVSGCYMMPAVYGQTSTGVVTSGHVYLAPLPIPKLTNFDQWNFEVTTAAASSTAQLCIYDDDNGRPRDLYWFGNGTVSCASTGSKTQVLEDLVLPPGLWWMGIAVAAGSPTIRRLLAGSPFINLASLSISSLMCYDFTGSMPRRIGDLTSLGTTGSPPKMQMRVV